MKVFVTGGGGFLGLAIVRMLCERGDVPISYSRGHYDSLLALGVEHVVGDLDDGERLMDAMAGCEAVIHVAARAGVWGSWESYFRPNVIGTENVLSACRANGIKQLVFTSSPSVIYAGEDSFGDESLPYPSRYDGYYPWTKALAEQLVMAADGDGLRTVSLRPHLIWGPGDTHFLPRFFERAKQNRLALLGNRPNLVDCIYVDNAAHAHLLALAALRNKPEQVGGNTYFISQNRPISIESLINQLIATGGFAPVQRRIPVAVALSTAHLLEAIWRRFALAGEPPLTVFTAKQLSTSHYYAMSAAQRDLGYRPLISIEEGMARLANWVAENSEGSV